MNFNGNQKIDSFNFIDPTKDHCRFEEKDSDGEPKYIRDIEYVTRNGVRPKCLSMNPASVHTTPNLIWTGVLGRATRVFKGENAIEEFLANLDEAL